MDYSLAFSGSDAVDSGSLTLSAKALAGVVPVSSQSRLAYQILGQYDDVGSPMTFAFGPGKTNSWPFSMMVDLEQEWATATVSDIDFPTVFKTGIDHVDSVWEYSVDMSSSGTARLLSVATATKTDFQFSSPTTGFDDDEKSNCKGSVGYGPCAAIFYAQNRDQSEEIQMVVSNATNPLSDQAEAGGWYSTDARWP